MNPSSTRHPGISILKRREAAELSREGLAAAAEVSLRTIERIETGAVKPRRATLRVIETALTVAEEAA